MSMFVFRLPTTFALRPNSCSFRFFSLGFVSPLFWLVLISRTCYHSRRKDDWLCGVFGNHNSRRPGLFGRRWLYARLCSGFSAQFLFLLHFLDDLPFFILLTWLTLQLFLFLRFFCPGSCDLLLISLLKTCVFFHTGGAVLKVFSFLSCRIECIK